MAECHLSRLLNSSLILMANIMLILGGRTKSLGHSQSLCLETEVTGMIPTTGGLTSLLFRSVRNIK